MLATQNNIIEKTNHFQFKNFLECGVLACFSTRNFDLGFGCANMENNRKEFLKSLAIDYKDLVCCQQPHGAKAAIIREQDKGKGSYSFVSAIAGCDALITDCKNIPLAVLTADCLPIFLFSRKNRIIAIIHAGWRGIKDDILGNTISLMVKNFQARPADLLVGIGPGIRNCCYEVKDEFKSYFPQAISERNNRLFLDLAKLNLDTLMKIGIDKKNIFDCGFCTCCSVDKFFSFRKEGQKAGRLMSLIMLK